LARSEAGEFGVNRAGRHADCFATEFSSFFMSSATAAMTALAAESDAATSAPSRAWWVPDLALLVLLGTEVVALSVAFDTWRLDAVHSVWSNLIAWSPQAARLALAIGMAIVLLDGRRLLSALATAARPRLQARVRALAVHWGAVATFAWLTSILVNGDVQALVHRPGWTLAWLAAGAAAAAEGKVSDKQLRAHQT
jgi:hypothetical protein